MESASAKGEQTRIELSPAQQTVARRIAEAKATVPHLYLRSEVEMTAALEMRDGLGGDPSPTLNDLVLKATALALRSNPRANGAYRDGGIELYSRINLAFTVDTGDSINFPVLVDTDEMGLTEIAETSHALTARARSGEITSPELSGATFTVSNLGMFGVTGFDAVVNGGQAGILSVGKVGERLTMREGELFVAHPMELGLACDHRILLGADGARLLDAIRENLENPDRLT